MNELMQNENLRTPCLVIDAQIMRNNLKRMADYAAQHKLKLRPHTKTHKSLAIARQQLELGAAGLTIAKVGEAQVMANAGQDLLLAYPAVDKQRCGDIAALAGKVTLRVAVDSLLAAQSLSAAAKAAGTTVGILVDIDVGMHRTGVQTPQAALELAQDVSKLPGLRLDGLFFYPGQVWNKPQDQAAALAAVDAILGRTLELWRKAGFEAKIVSGGSTPTAFQSHLVKSATEIRPGTYVFNDMNCVHGGFITQNDCAARIICTVVSTAVPGQIVLDAGTKTLTSDRCGPAPDSGHGRIVEYPAAKIVKLTEEHGQTDITGCERAPQLGERVSVIPNHICPCVNLQDNVYLFDGGKLQPLAVDARGKLF